MKTNILPWLVRIFVLISWTNVFSQGVGIGTTSPNASAGLHVSFTDKGLLIPQVDLSTSLGTTEAGSQGLMVYNTSYTILLGEGLYVNRSYGTTPDWAKVTTNILGSGIPTRVAFWGNANTLSHSQNLYWDNMNSRLGIGTTEPAQQMTVTGNYQLPATTGAAAGGIWKPGYSYIHDYGNYNEFFGYAAGNFTLTGMSNIGIGDDVLSLLTSGSDNTSVGDYSMHDNTSGHSNVAIGTLSLENNTTGIHNISIGTGTMQSNTLGQYNIAIGSEALRAQSSGGGEPNTYNLAVGHYALFTTNPTDMNNGRLNTGIGTNALRLNSIGYDNIAIGYMAMYNNADGGSNIAIGNSALYTQASGSGNSSTANLAIGSQALYKTSPSTSSNGRRNLGIGYMALRENVTGTENIATGYFASYNTTGDMNTSYGAYAMINTGSASNNTAIGNAALYNNLTGSNNVAIGKSADVNYSNLNNTVVIGYNTSATASNEVRLGNASTASFYCAGIYAATGAYFDVTVSGSGQLVRNTSSKRYKTDIANLEINTSKVYQLRPVSFTRISDNERTFGLIAEEVAEVIPELALYAKEADVVKGSDSDKMVPESVQYQLLSVLLLKELQKHEERIEQLEKEIKALKEGK